MAQKINFLGTGNSTPKPGYKEISDVLKAKLDGMTTAEVVEQGLLTISTENPVKEISLTWKDKITGQEVVSEPFLAILFDQGAIRLSRGLDLATLNNYYANQTFGTLVFRLSEQPNKRGIMTKYFRLGKPGSELAYNRIESVEFATKAASAEKLGA